MISRTANKRFLVISLAVVAIAVAFILTINLNAQVNEPASSLQVGIYSPQVVFEQSPGQAKLMEIRNSIQAEMEQAQAAGDSQKMQQLQQKFEQQRARAIDEFQRDMDEVLPSVARVAGVDVVALEVVYTGENVGTKDITDSIILALSEN